MIDFTAQFSARLPPRTEPSREQIDLDYNNGRPLVTGAALFCMDVATQQVRWQHEGLVINPTITIADDRVYCVSATSESLYDHPTGRIFLKDLLASGTEILALDASTGEVVWKQAVDSYMAPCRNIIYLQAADGLLILSGSFVRENDSWYRVMVLDAATGATVWQAEHAKGKPGEFGHGEQVHHPVVLGNRLICEPVIYELASGQRITPDGEMKSWTFTRPAHSCGTMSGAGDCLFFRSANPTVMDLQPGVRERMRTISPTRPGCWINIVARGRFGVDS